MGSLLVLRILISSPRSLDSPPVLYLDPTPNFRFVNIDPATTLIAGVLGFLTVGWWGSFSDRHGRTRILGIVAIGQLMCSLNVILVANYVQVLPGNYWFLVVDSIILGAVGGMSSSNTISRMRGRCNPGTASETAAMMAYLSDIVPPEQR